MIEEGRLAVTVTHADGSTTRWGPDEVDAGAIPNDLTFGTTTPGGFKDMTCSLLRDLNPRTDESLYDTVRVYGAGNQTAWEGRIAQLPRQTSPGTLTPGAIGWSAHLTDDQTFMEIYVDRDPGSWQSPSLVTKASFASMGASQDGVPTSTAGGLSFTPTASQALAGTDLSALVYICPAGLKVAAFEYIGVQYGAWTGFETPTLYASASEAFTSPDTYAVTLDGNFYGIGLSPARRYILLWAQTLVATTPPAGLARTYLPIAVYGNHGLSRYTTIAGQPEGLYGSDVIADIISRAAPLLQFTTGTGGTITPTGFSIPHLVFKEPTTAADAVATVNAYHGFDWLVWEERTFYFQPAGGGVEWQARIGDGAVLALDGDSAEQVIDSVVVSYTDGGVQKYAGPVGSGLDVEDAALQTTDPGNPVVSHSITRRPLLGLSNPTTDAGAVEQGALFLGESNLAARRGQVTLTGRVRHPDEGLVPVWRVRAGDTIKISDRPGDPARRIIETSYSHAAKQVTLTLDSTAHKLDALQERLAVTGSLIS